MQFENRQPTEGINVSRQNPFTQFLKLLVSASVFIVLVVVLLNISGGWLAKRIPFSYEISVMETLDIELGDADANIELVGYLDDLAMRLMSNMPIPEGMSVTLHYKDDPTFNAFATVGGNLLLYRGLLQELPHENALAMLLAHEISHVLHRDPVAGLGGGVATSLALLALTGSSGTGVAGSLLSNTGQLTSVRFTREMETAADTQALAAVQAEYGHVNGAQDLFSLFQQQRGELEQDIPLLDRVPEWLERFASTHPLDNDRVQAIATLAQSRGWSQTGFTVDLPPQFLNWLRRH